MDGLRNPMLGLPCEANFWLTSAMRPAHMGAAKLVPPNSLARQVVWLAQVKKVKSAFAATSGPLRSVLEPRLVVLITPASFWYAGMAIRSGEGEMPPPLSTHADSVFLAPPAPVVTRSVPPTDTTYVSSAGHASLRRDHVELSPEAAKKFWPCAAIRLKKGSSVLGSAGVQPQEQPIVVGKGLWLTMALIIAVSLEPMYSVRLASPGAMPRACVMSSVCSVSSQLPPARLCTHEVLVPSVESSVIGTELVCPAAL